MQTTLALLVATLTTGMTTGHTTADDYYVKTWYTGDPLAFPAMALPAGVAIPMDEPRKMVYAGEDTVWETVSIRLYQPALRKSGDAQETSAGLTRIVAMVDRAILLLRTDPTFASAFVTSEILGTTFRVSGIGATKQVGGDAYRAAEIRFQAWRRALWGAA